MYQVDHMFEDLEPGSIVEWNGRERHVEELGDDYAVIGGTTLSKHRINGMFKSHDTPFQMRGR